MLASVVSLIALFVTTPPEAFAFGAMEKLSKYWMPLDQYIELTMEGLQNGDSHITAGTGVNAFNQFETEKVEFAQKISKTLKSI
ncbi:hypothetical protein C0991_005273 [Blastosporella zonata]|nr:hypothetical protein C0991_005273 [Blastosporella zonata]